MIGESYTITKDHFYSIEDLKEQLKKNNVTHSINMKWNISTDITIVINELIEKYGLKINNFIRK